MSMDFLLTCSQVTSRLTDYQEGALSPLASFRVGLHLALCKGCQRFRASLKELPKWMGGPSQADHQDIALAVLARAKTRLGRPRPSRIPEPLAAELSAGGDGLLRLQALTHLAFAEGRIPKEAPFLPPEVLEQLPDPASWTWWSKGLRGARMARLTSSSDGKQDLMLLSIPGGRRFPAHRHLGQESILILHGGLDDGTGVAEPGHWRFYSEGHPDHAPDATSEGCWALIRVDAGGIRLRGWRGWFQGWLE